MRFKYTIFLLIFSQCQLCSQGSNPAERYSTAYREYLDAGCPIAPDNMRHFVYFARDRKAIREHAFLKQPRIEGAQVMYAWRQLESARGRYDFSIVHEDLNYLQSKGKKLFIQLQDATFDPKYRAVPDDLLTDAYDGGAIYQYNDAGAPEGWVAKRWNPAVRARFGDFLMAQGQDLDGQIEGINLQESAIGVSSEHDASFTPSAYVKGLKENMESLKRAFPRSTTMQYANFMAGEWLPWDDKGYLKAIYEHGQDIGVGLGAPDLMVRRKGQLNHALAMMHEHAYTVPLGIAVQDGNYIGQTGSNQVLRNRKNLVPMLHAFAKDFLKVDYMFWAHQEPYFTEDVLPCLEAR